MMTSSNGNIFSVTGALCGEFTGQLWIYLQRQVTRSFDVFFDLRLNKRLSKQSRIWWFETSSLHLWRHCNADQLWRKLLIIGGLQVQKSSDDTASNVSCEKGKREKGSNDVQSKPEGLLSPIVAPFALLCFPTWIKYWCGKVCWRECYQQQHTSKDNPTSQWHIDTDSVSYWLYAF